MNMVLACYNGLSAAVHRIEAFPEAGRKHLLRDSGDVSECEGFVKSPIVLLPLKTLLSIFY